MATATKTTVEWAVPARSKHYLAALDGEDPRYGLRREFLQGRKVGREWIHDLAPGFYEMQEVIPKAERKLCPTCGHANDTRRLYFAVTTAGAVEYLNDYVAELDRITAGPPLDGPYVAEVADDGHKAPHGPDEAPF